MSFGELPWCKEIWEEIIDEDKEDTYKEENKKAIELKTDLAVETKLHKIWLKESRKKDNKIESVKKELIKLRGSIDKILRSLE